MLNEFFRNTKNKTKQKNYRNLRITVRENVFQEAEPQSFGALLKFVLKCFAVGKFARVDRFNAPRCIPSRTSDDVTTKDRQSVQLHNFGEIGLGTYF